MREPTRPLPKSNGGWLTEMAAAYLDAREAIPFGDPRVLGDPYLAFAFCYLASHYGLRLLTAERVEELMAHTGRNRKALARLIAGGTTSGTAGGPSRRRRPNRPRS